MSAPPRGPMQSAALLALGMLGLGLLLDGSVLHLLGPDLVAFGTAFLLATTAFAVGEAIVLHVEFGRNAHTVSVAELTLAVSLFFVPGAELPVARVLGGGLVLVLVRRQRPLKICFNLALWVLDVAVATVVFRALGGALHAGPAHLVVPALAAALSSAAVDSIAVNAVIALTSRDLDLVRAVRFVGTCILNALACGIGALVCVGALAFSTWMVVPLAMVVALFLLAFHHFAVLRAQHRNVKVLYDFAGQLSRTPHGQQVLATVLQRVGELLRAERVSLYLEQNDPQLIHVTELDDELGTVTGEMARDEVPSLLLATLDRSDPVVLAAGIRHPSVRRFLREYDARDAVLAPLQGEQSLRGVLVIADRRGEVTTFGNDDGLLLQTLASHAAAALANSRLMERLDHDSLHDSLTGLANRGKFLERLRTVLERGGHSVAVLLMDLDRFKEVNDTLGHHHGDLLLQEIAGRLSRQVRGNDLLARLGGDEFAVLMTDLTEAEATDTAQRLIQALGRPMRLQGVEMEVNASIGVVHVPATGPSRLGLDAQLLLQRADVAMYCAKQGYSGAHLYQDELDGYSPRRLALASGLRTGIEQGQLSVRYQPQSRLSDEGVVGAEALVRWDHPLYGEVRPDDFIAIAEQTGQIRELTRFVLDRALASCASWSANGSHLAISVNLSVRNLMEPDLVDAVADLLALHGLSGDRLTLEITESHLMSDPARTTEVLGGLAALGVRLSIDDFGTGYSSLAYLKQLPVAEIKVDKSFVRDIAGDDEDAAIVEAITQLAHSLRMEVVAEGVEDARAQQRLTEIGCDLFQGYHLARPMREAEFTRWLAEHTSSVPRLRAVPNQRTASQTSQFA